jgi:hypothetical protein
MQPSQLQATGRWLIFTAMVAGMNAAALYWVVTARSTWIDGIGSGPRQAYCTYYTMYDGSVMYVVRNHVTGAVKGPIVVKPATPAGLCRVWWPAVAGGLLNLLAFSIVLSRRGRRLIAEFPLPRMTTRRWMIVVAVIGTECGLVISMLRNRGIDPLSTPWTPIFVYLVGLHAMAFLLAGMALLYRFARPSRFHRSQF